MLCGTKQQKTSSWEELKIHCVATGNTLKLVVLIHCIDDVSLTSAAAQEAILQAASLPGVRIVATTDSNRFYYA